MSDAVRRLLTQGGLTEADRADNVAVMKATAVLPDAQHRKPQRVTLDALPEGTAACVNVSITTLRNPRNLNSIGFNEGITFESAGLTVVYVNNGSGKTGNLPSSALIGMETEQRMGAVVPAKQMGLK